MNTPEEFLTDLAKDLIQCDPMNRQEIVRGYARHMEAREEEIRKEAYIKGGIETINNPANGKDVEI